MAEFLELVENIKAEEASVHKLFGDGGGEVSTASARNRLEAKLGPAAYATSLREAVEFVADIYSGRRPVHQLREAMTTSDFPYLFGEILDRQLLAGYRETPTTYDRWCKVKTVADFRTVSRKYTDGGDGTLSAVSEQGEYPLTARTEGKYEYAVKKYGAAFDISWETLINDDLDALKDTPERMGRSARRTEEKFATGLVATSSGPDSTFFSSGNGNLGTAGTISAVTLAEAYTAFGNQTDAGGEPIFNQPAILMVPPALEITAMNVLNAMSFRYAGDGTVVDTIEVANWVKSRLTLVVNYYLPVIDTTKGDTAWYLFSNPNEGRGAVEIGKLRGHEEPEVFQKVPNQQRIGGGANVMDGDFDHDSIMYKVRHVLGGTVLDPKFAFANAGS